MKKTLSIVIIFIFQASFGQVRQFIVKTTHFLTFDTVHGSLETDKFVFFKNTKLDISKSIVFLDSLAQCMQNNPTIIVTITVTKGYDAYAEYEASAIAQKQAQQIADYLVNVKKISVQRVVGRAICSDAPFLVKDEDPEIVKRLSKDRRIRTRIKILSRDYRPR